MTTDPAGFTAHSAEKDARCIALTDRHARCKGKALADAEFCRRHAPWLAPGRVIPPAKTEADHE